MYHIVPQLFQGVPSSNSLPLVSELFIKDLGGISLLFPTSIPKPVDISLCSHFAIAILHLNNYCSRLCNKYSRKKHLQERNNLLPMVYLNQRSHTFVSISWLLFKLEKPPVILIPWCWLIETRLAGLGREMLGVWVCVFIPWLAHLSSVDKQHLTSN